MDLAGREGGVGWGGGVGIGVGMEEGERRACCGPVKVGGRDGGGGWGLVVGWAGGGGCNETSDWRLS